MTLVFGMIVFYETIRRGILGGPWVRRFRWKQCFDSSRFNQSYPGDQHHQAMGGELEGKGRGDYSRGEILTL